MTDTNSEYFSSPVTPRSNTRSLCGSLACTITNVSSLLLRLNHQLSVLWYWRVQRSPDVSYFREWCLEFFHFIVLRILFIQFSIMWRCWLVSDLFVDVFFGDYNGSSLRFVVTVDLVCIVCKEHLRITWNFSEYSTHPATYHRFQRGSAFQGYTLPFQDSNPTASNLLRIFLKG